MPRQVLVTGPSLDEAAIDLLEQHNCSVVFAGAYSQGSDLELQISEYRPNAIISRMGQLNRDAISKALPDLEVIAKHGVGVDNIDVAAATEHGVPVCISMGANAISVAEQTMALVLAVTKKICVLDSRIRDGHWDKPNFKGYELNGRTLCLFGMGAIAQAMANLARAFGLRLVGYDPFAEDSVFDAFGVIRCHSINELFTQADIMSLHAPLNDATRNVVNEKTLALMPQGSLIVNTARGGLIDENALLASIKMEHLAGAGLDTFAVEPIASNHPFLDESRIVVSPHVGGVTTVANRRVALRAAQNVIAILDGHSLESSLVVNHKHLSAQAVQQP